MEKTKTNNALSTKEESISEQVIQIDRITKVVKGGKRMSFRAFVIAGDRNGSVGFGLGKAKEVPSAIKKGVDKARRNLKLFHIVDGTLPHDVEGRYGAARVYLKPARPGTGVIAGGSVRILLESLGLRNVVAKSFSNNGINAVKAAIEGLQQCKNLKVEEALRGKSLPVYFVKDEYQPIQPIVKKEIPNKKHAKPAPNRKGPKRPERGKDNIKTSNEATEKNNSETPAENAAKN